ncbi:MFS transporter [Bacillus sonorensis]|uniref:MFS transporter n=1 Tax=Bacillus sonorensis TaxID=119858 RepID=UPI001F2BFD3E|nr:MFS transporter [Bacillus sonorensis]MCF7617064.1 MFS transporter [Bacillus sonorensis]
MSVENRLGLNKPFNILIGSQILSNFADWIQLLAVLSLAGFQFHASSLEMSALMICFAVPAIGIGPLAGGLADRYNRKTIMMISEIGRSCIAFMMLFAGSIWHIYILLLLLSSCSAFFTPAKNGKLKEIIPGPNMQQAVSVSGMVDQGSKILGPALGGGLIAAFGIDLSFYFNAALFLFSGLLLSALPKDRFFERIDAEGKPRVRMLAGFTQGLVLIQKNSLLLTGLAVSFFVILVLQMADSQIAVLIRELPGAPAELLGFCMAASGTGMLSMTALLGKITIRSFLSCFITGSMLLGISIGSAPLITGRTEEWLYILFPIVFLIGGAGFTLVYIPFHILTQQTVDSAYIGRVFGTVQSLTTLGSVAGMAGGGLLAQWAGVKSAFILSGSLLTAFGAAIMIWSKERGASIVTETHEGTERQTED